MDADKKQQDESIHGPFIGYLQQLTGTIERQVEHLGNLGAIILAVHKDMKWGRRLLFIFIASAGVTSLVPFAVTFYRFGSTSSAEAEARYWKEQATQSQTQLQELRDQFMEAQGALKRDNELIEGWKKNGELLQSDMQQCIEKLNRCVDLRTQRNGK